ncbi:hypothetical protein Q4596_00385 [Pseudoalteromonas carrageenovora]|uniref:hypothetical protein n=1 Tax=Pseudoalteromonas carrageenovora TaxID=227 RepID=UPI0026E3876F|nr:hypothetical protein [Pseudoalteromonas carrageenovora]MDO6834056.1 hypothetical protein [Pseudoalteromonas carrageenovora]
MKRISPLSKVAKIDIASKKISDINSLTLDLTLYKGTKVKLNFKEWIGANPTQNCRACVLKVVKKYHELKQTESHDSIEAKFKQFQLYVNFCITKHIDPFTKEAYRAYVGKGGELRRLEALASNPHPYIFMYKNNEQIGVSSSTCKTNKVGIIDTLKKAEIYDYTFEYNVGEFSFDKVAQATQPYSDKELSTSLRRLQYFFYSLASQLIAIKRNSNDQADFSRLIATVDKTEHGILKYEVRSRVTNKPKLDSIPNGSPINRAMQAAYYLFCYFTSFNESSIYDVCHPLEEVTSKKDSRTLKTITIKAWKSRANKEVESLVSDSGNRYILADVEKKDGLKFVNTLIELSKLYNPESDKSHQPLIYFLDNGSNLRNIGESIGYAYLSKELGLYSDNRPNVASHLAKLYTLLHNDACELIYSLPNDKIMGRRVSIEKHAVHKAQLNRKLLLLGYSIFRCFTDENLKNAIRPLKYLNSHEDGCFDVEFSFYGNINHTCRVTFPNSFKDFIELFEKKSDSLLPIEPSKFSGKNQQTYPPYLFTSGRRAIKVQWEGIELTSHKYLQARGVTASNFFLNLSSRRFRATTASNGYDPVDGGYELSKYILNNTFDTLSKHYVNGNDSENKKVVGQALEILTEINNGTELEEAKDLIKHKLKIDILSYDEWKAKRLPPSNINGIVCNGKPKLDKSVKNQFNASMKFATIFLPQSSISCYQFDKCSHCKSAKIVDDIRFVFKTLSYIEALRERVDRMPYESEKYQKEADYLAEILEGNVSEEVLNAAYEKLDSEGPSPLITDHFIDLFTGYSE